MTQGIDGGRRLGRRLSCRASARPVRRCIGGARVDRSTTSGRRRTRATSHTPWSPRPVDRTYLLSGTATDAEFADPGRVHRRGGGDSERERTPPTPGRRWSAATTVSSRVSRCIRVRTSSAARSSRTARRRSAAAVRLQRLAPGGGDHLRQRARRPVRGAQRRAGHLGLGGRLARIRRRRAERAADHRARPRRVRGRRRRDRLDPPGCCAAATAHRLADRPDRSRRRARRRRPTARLRMPPRSVASTCATPSPSCWSAPN